MKIKAFFKTILNNRNFPFPVFWAYILLSMIGLLFIHSATININEPFALKQFFWFTASLIVMTVIQSVHYRYLYPIVPFLFALSLILLLLVLLTGPVISGSTRWFSLGFIKLQPSEIAKIATILMIAFYLSTIKPPLENLKHFLNIFFILVLPIFLILKEPDLGTSIVFTTIIFPILYWRGFRFLTLAFLVLPIINILAAFSIWTWFIFFVILLIMLFYSRLQMRILIFIFLLNTIIGIVTPYIWNHLHDYQKKRILVFLNPEKDKLSSGYHIIQSKISIGSGGFYGKGLLQGSQKNLRFLPEQHTDFIFSVIGEETGFLGCSIVIILFGSIFFYSIQIASETRNLFGQLIIIGCVSVLFFQMLINIGMTIGLMPVTGIPLPFISYGGSSLLTNSVMIGLILNIGRHRYDY